MRTLETPNYINWNFTYRCNFYCKHCYSRVLRSIELSTEDNKKIAQKLVDSQVFQVNMGGGEPLLRDDFFEITKLLTDGGVKVNLTTNGYKFSEETAQKLKEVGLGTLFVSLDDIREEKHDEFRNKKGSFQEVKKCIDIAKEHGLEVILSTVITKQNLPVLDDIVKFAEEKNISGIDFKKIRPQGNAIKNQEHYLLDENDTNVLIEKIEKYKKESPLKIFFIYSENGIKGVDEGCPCGRISIALLPNGDLTPCVYNQVIIGNLLESDLKTIWQKSPLLVKLRVKFRCVGEMSQKDLENYMKN